MPIGRPGWPDFAFSTASIARARIALAMSLALTPSISSILPIVFLAQAVYRRFGKIVLTACQDNAVRYQPVSAAGMRRWSVLHADFHRQRRCCRTEGPGRNGPGGRRHHQPVARGQGGARLFRDTEGDLWRGVRPSERRGCGARL